MSERTLRLMRVLTVIWTVLVVIATLLLGVLVGIEIGNREIEKRSAAAEAAAADTAPVPEPAILDEYPPARELHDLPEAAAEADIVIVDAPVEPESAALPQQEYIIAESIIPDVCAPVIELIEEKTESEVAAAGYYRSDIPMAEAEQAQLWEACLEFGVPYELALAVIWQETHFMNVDSGSCKGYMQIMPKWVWPEMEQIGATDLMIPLDNFRVGCCLLGKFIAQHGVAGGLTRYNTGSPGHNSYAKSVISKWEKLQNGEVTI